MSEEVEKLKNGTPQSKLLLRAFSEDEFRVLFAFKEFNAAVSLMKTADDAEQAILMGSRILTSMDRNYYSPGNPPSSNK